MKKNKNLYPQSLESAFDLLAISASARVKSIFYREASAVFTGGIRERYGVALMIEAEQED